jgi:hypothetical protein
MENKSGETHFIVTQRDLSEGSQRNKNKYRYIRQNVHPGSSNYTEVFQIYETNVIGRFETKLM